MDLAFLMRLERIIPDQLLKCSNSKIIKSINYQITRSLIVLNSPLKKEKANFIFSYLMPK